MTARIPLAALLVLAPLLWSAGNENTALVKSFMAGVIAAFILLTTPPRRLFGSSPAAVPALALGTLLLGGTLASPSPSFSWTGFIPFASFLVVGLAAAGGLVASGFPGRAIILSSVIPVLLGLLQASGLDPTSWQVTVNENFHGRICSTLGNPNFLGAWLAGVLPFVAAGAVAARGTSRTVHSALLAAGLIVLLLSGSRGGLLGGIGAAAVLLLALRKAGRLPGLPIRKAALAFLAVAVLGAVVLVTAPPKVRDRLLFADSGEAGATGAGIVARNESVRFRVLTWRQSARAARETPVLGAGAGRFQVVYPRWRLPEIIRMFGQHSYMTDHPENIWLETLVEAGIIGLGLLLWLFAAAARALNARLAATSSRERLQAAGCAGSLAGLVVSNSFGVDIHYGATAALAAVVLGAALSVPPTPPGLPDPAGRPEPAISRRPSFFGVAAAAALSLAWARLYTSDALLARGLALSRPGTWDAAVSFYARSRVLNPGNVIARYFGASALMDRGRTEDIPAARVLLEGVRAESPDYVLVNYKLWLLYNRAGLRREALAAMERQISLDPVASIFLLERGRAALDEGRAADARRDFEAAVQAEPGSPAGYQYLGNLLVLKKRYREALAVYEKGLSGIPGSSELAYNAAVAALRMGDRPLARAYALRVLASDPAHAQARLILGKTQ